MIDLENTTSLELEQMAINVTSKLGESLKEWAISKAAFEELKEFTKTVLFGAMPNDGKVTEKEKIAYTSHTYTLHLEGMACARAEYLKRDAEVDTYKAKLDVLRTVISARKEEIKRFNG